MANKGGGLTEKQKSNLIIQERKQKEHEAQIKKLLFEMEKTKEKQNDISFKTSRLWKNKIIRNEIARIGCFLETPDKSSISSLYAPSFFIKYKHENAPIFITT